MAAAQKIYEGQDFWVPRFELKLADRPVGRDVVHDVLQVTYKDDIEAMDSVEVTINNWDAENLRFKYSDGDLFDPGKELELALGYFGQGGLRRMIRGKITALRPSFPAAGAPTLAITALNVLKKLHRKQESHAYWKMKDSQIAEKVAARLGVTLKTQARDKSREEPREYVFQDNRFDIVFLMELARRNGYDLFLEEDGQSIFFGSTENVKKVTYELSYRRSLIDFKPNLTTANQVAEVTVRGWDSVNKKPIEATVKRKKGEYDEAFKERREIVADRPIQSPREAKDLAQETMSRITKDMLTGTGTTVGLPYLRAGSAIRIDGLGRRFNGSYFVTSTTHTLGESGYTTQFECRRDEPGS